jgi:hypothetical protein
MLSSQHDNVVLGATAQISFASHAMRDIQRNNFALLSSIGRRITGGPGALYYDYFCCLESCILGIPHGRDFCFHLSGFTTGGMMMGMHF